MFPKYLSFGYPKRLLATTVDNYLGTSFFLDDIKSDNSDSINDNLNMYINDHLRMYTSDYALI